MLDSGTKAPDFALPDQNGNVHRLEDHRGQKVILYFYPADMSPGCTNQACNFRDLYAEAMLIAYNAKNKYRLPVKKLYGNQRDEELDDAETDDDTAAI